MLCFLYCKYHLQICSLTLDIVFDIICNTNNFFFFTNSFYYKKMWFVICELCLNKEIIFFQIYTVFLFQVFQFILQILIHLEIIMFVHALRK